MPTVTEIRNDWAEIHIITPEAHVPSTTSHNLFLPCSLQYQADPFLGRVLTRLSILKVLLFKISMVLLKMNAAIYYSCYLEESLVNDNQSWDNSEWGFSQQSSLSHALIFFLNQWITDSEEMVGEETDVKTW